MISSAKVYHFASAEVTMPAAEVMSMVDSEHMAAINARDKHPQIRVYSIGHDGAARGTVSNLGSRVLHYFNSAISGMYNRLKLGTLAFVGHFGESNSHAGREPIGQVVGKRLQTIGDKLHSLAAVWIYPEHRDKELDVASVEAKLSLSDPGGEIEVIDVVDVTGIALGNSSRDLPGFPGAQLLGLVQHFTGQGDPANHNPHGGDRTMNKDEIKAAIAAAGLTAGDLFTTDMLVTTQGVAEHIKSALQTKHEHARRVEERLAETRNEFEAARAKFDEERKTLIQKAQAVELQLAARNVEDVFGKVATELKLTTPQVAFVKEISLDKFKIPETADAIEPAMRKFVTNAVERDFATASRLLGVTRVDDTGKAASAAGSTAGISGSPGLDLAGAALTAADRK